MSDIFAYERRVLRSKWPVIYQFTSGGLPLNLMLDTLHLVFEAQLQFL
jgi:hypothetical protein